MITARSTLSGLKVVASLLSVLVITVHVLLEKVSGTGGKDWHL